MRSPTQYKTRYGLYNATIKALDTLTTTKKAWWIHNALYHCEKNFPDLLPQLKQLIFKPMTLEQLERTNEINN